MTTRHQLEIMLGELESHQLHVVLVPLNPRLRGWNEGGCKRVCADRNPTWYRHLCQQFPSSRVRNHRKPDTRIKRRNTLRALRQLIARKPAGKYAGILLSIAQAQKLRGAA